MGIELDPDDLESVVAKLGPMAILIGATLRNTVNPTMLAAGYKVNVIPGQAEAHVDGRFLPIPCIGFSPLRLPPDLDFAGMFHGVDERVPVEALQFGTRVLDRFLDLA
jgi:acetylornithine deacetylase/succinyl-diaminopimelate desuccinylase-like protein